MKHKHADLIIAWANGAEIQFREYEGKWNDFQPNGYACWHQDMEYRIKPEPKPETLDTRSYLIGRYDGLRELSDATIRELSVAFMLVLRRTSEDELFESVYEYSKLLLKKASEMTDKESAIYATGYWNGIASKKLRELSDEEINELANKYLYVLNDVPYANDIKDFARAIEAYLKGEK